MWQRKIDGICLISLQERTDRRNLFYEQSAKYKFPVWCKLAIKEDRGEVGLRKTMKELFLEIKADGIGSVIVFEDDAEILHDDFNERLNACVEELPIDFLTLNLGINLLTPVELYSNNLYKVALGYAAHAVIYSAEAVERIIELLDEDLPYDVILAKHIQPLKRSYCTTEILVTQRESVSDIAKLEEYKSPEALKYIDKQKGIVKWGQMMQDRFELFTKYAKR